MDQQETRAAVQKRAWFYYALAKFAVMRNLVVALAIAVMCVGATGLTLWAVELKQDADAAAGPGSPELQSIPPAQRPMSAFYSQGNVTSDSGGTSVKTNPDLYYTVHLRYLCGHECTFIPAERGLDIYELAGYKASVSQSLCTACRALADCRVRPDQEKKATAGGHSDAAH